MSLAKIGITLGDPSGIGPEIVRAALAALPDDAVRRAVVFGDRACVGEVAADVVEVTALGPEDRAPGQPTEAGARAQLAYLEAAVAAAQRGELAAIVTAPISKTQIKRAGFAFDGHTEFLADRFGAARHAMMFAGPRLRVVLATIHVPHREVSSRLTVAGLVDKIELAAEALVRDFAVQAPRIAVAGLNPHAGERGLFGGDERDVIGPAVAQAQARGGLPAGTVVTGPLVPDAVFRDAVDGAYDAVVAMYHDQALIPVKLVDFEEAVNVTLGLPIVRTSPDHGVAYDIAGKGTARATSFTRAVELACAMVDRRG